MKGVFPGGVSASEDVPTSEAGPGEGEEQETPFEELGAAEVLSEAFAQSEDHPGITESPGSIESSEPLESRDVDNLESIDAVAMPPATAEVGMSLPPSGPAEEKCRKAWFAKIRRLEGPVLGMLDVEHRLSWGDAFERVQRAIHLGERDVNLLTDFAYFAMEAFMVGILPGPSWGRQQCSRLDHAASARSWRDVAGSEAAGPASWGRSYAQAPARTALPLPMPRGHRAG